MVELEAETSKTRVLPLRTVSLFVYRRPSRRLTIILHAVCHSCPSHSDSALGLCTSCHHCTVLVSIYPEQVLL